MTELSDERLAEWKASFAEAGIHYDTDDEYREAVHNLVGYFELLIEMDQQQKQSKQNQIKEKHINP